MTSNDQPPCVDCICLAICASRFDFHCYDANDLIGECKILEKYYFNTRWGGFDTLDVIDEYFISVKCKDEKNEQ
jgi:hypothetical protein